MKKLILMILIALPMVMSAQKTKPGVRDIRSEAKEQTYVPRYYGEILVTEQQGRDIIRVMFDNKSMAQILNKDMKVEIEAIRAYRFQNILQTINYLSSMGWELGEMFAIERRVGREVHMLISKEAPKLQKPDLSDNGNKPASKGTNKR